MAQTQEERWQFPFIVRALEQQPELREAYPILERHHEKHLWSDGAIYFIQTGRRGPIKIGWSHRNVAARLSSIRLANPRNTCLLGCIPGTMAGEKHLHKILGDYRMSGEWFSAEGDVLEHIHFLYPGLPPRIKPAEEEEFAGTTHDCEACQSYISWWDYTWAKRWAA